MNTPHALQNLLNNTASEEEIELLKRLLASGEISIGGNVNQSVIIIGSGNTVELPPAALDRLGARSLLGNLERDLTGDEIAAGLARLESELPLRAPALLNQFQEQARRLRPTFKTDPNALSESARKERLEALAYVNSLCMEALDISFNAVALGEALPEYEACCPFRGLESFRVEDREFFFGREELTQKLVGKIKAHSFLAVLGASGSGKSSLVMAGMIPTLDLDYAVIRPGTNPLEALESARGKSLLVVDQFEELFTLTRDEKTRADFISALLDSTKSGRVIITLRSDFLGEVGAYRSLSGEIQNHLEIIPPMNADELRRAMEEQARWARLEFEADLSQQILDDVAGEPGAMPLLQHALWELWNRRHGRHLRANEYRAFGGVKQAITSAAENVYGKCSKSEQEQLRDIFLRLTRLDEGDEGRDTRRRVPLDDLIPSGADAASISTLLDKLVNARLIVKTVKDEVTEIEVAHEALIRHWERLRIWLNEDRDNLHLRESVSESAKEWEKSGKHESLLNSRWVKLDEALLLAQDSRYRLTEIEQAYLKACVGLRNKEQHERERRLRLIVIASIMAAIIFLVLGGFGWIQRNEAIKQANNALARQLAAQAQILNLNIGLDAIRSGLLSVEAGRRLPGFEADQALRRYLDVAALPTWTGKHDNRVYSVSYSPDGNFIVSSSYDNTIRVWEASTGKEVVRMDPPYSAGGVMIVAYSPDGKYIVSGGFGIARVWDALIGREVAQMQHQGYISSVAFSPDGEYVVSGSSDGSIRIWQALTGREVARMQIHQGINSVAFSPDGKYVISGSYDKTARVWEAFTGIEVARIVHEGPVNSVAYNPNGKYVGSASEDGTIQIWIPLTGEIVSTLHHAGSVVALTFSPDGKYILSGSADNTARVWDVVTGREIAHFTHSKGVNAVAFSPDGNYAATGSYDETARAWDIHTGEEIARMAHSNFVDTVTFSPDGKRIVSGSVDGTLRVWEATTGKDALTLNHKASIQSVSFSPAGDYIVTGSADNTAGVWETATGNEMAVIPTVGTVRCIKFTPDGKLVVLGDDYGNLQVWDLAGRKIIYESKQDDFIWTIDISPDGKYAVSSSSSITSVKGNARVWEIANGKEIFHVTVDGRVYGAVFSPDGRYVLTGSETMTGRVRIWDISTGNAVATMEQITYPESVAFSPDGKYIASNTAIWEVATSREVVNYGDISKSPINKVAFSPDGKYVVASSPNGIIYVLNALTGAEINHADYKVVSDVPFAFSKDGRYIVSGDGNGRVYVWETTTGSEVAAVYQDGPVTAVAFSPDNKYILSSSTDGTARLWYLRIEDLIDQACQHLPRNLSREEWEKYVGDEPYQATCYNLPIGAESTP